MSAPAHHAGVNIRKRRRELELSQRALAAAVGVHSNWIHRLERGYARPSLGLLTRLAETMQTTPAALALGAPEGPRTHERRR